MTLIEEIEIYVADEAMIELSELVGPNSLEFDIELDSHVDRRIGQFHTNLYNSIIGEFNHG